MTTYNGENFVEKQLDSLLKQTRPADEVVIVDDCSTDGTASLVRKFIVNNGLSNWHFSVNKKNVGYKRNFYNAISKTKGDIIFLSDQDDIWCAEKLEVMTEIFEKNNDVKALNSSFEFIDENDNKFEVSQLKNKSNNNIIREPIDSGELKNISVLTMCNYNISPGCTMALTKEIKEIYLSNTTCNMVHDWEINFIASCLGGLYFINRPLIRYRIHTSNTIGLDDITGKTYDMNKGKYEVRLKKAERMYDYIQCLKVYNHLFNSNIIQRQVDFVTKRKEALEKKSILKILSLYKYYDNYKKSVTFKGRVADIVCLIKR